MIEQLAQPFPPAMVKKAPQGKFGTYISHVDVTQRALSIVGLEYDFGVVEPIRGHAPEVKGKTQTWPARDNAIVGAVCELTVHTPDGPRTIREVGTEDSPAMHNDGENLKNAASDGYKRCWMRYGLGLEVWCKDGYWLPAQLAKEEA